MAGLVRPPEILELRTFVAAADAGSLGRAALRLGVSQPAISKRLASLERLAGVQLLRRSSRGVELTVAGRRLYEEARRLLAESEVVEGVMAGLALRSGPVRLAASHSAAEAFVAEALSASPETAVELVTANSRVVRGLVSDGRADVGVAARRPGVTPSPAIREEDIASDEVVCAVPATHPWARRERITPTEFLQTAMVVRDPGSSARWTVDSVLRERGLTAAAPLVETPTPGAAKREAAARNAPALLSRRVLHGDFFRAVAVQGLRFPRAYTVVLPAVGEPPGPVRGLVDRLRAAVAGW